MSDVQYLTFAEAAEHFGRRNGKLLVREKWIRENWRKRGMPGQRIGSNVLFPEDALKAWARQNAIAL